MRARSFTIIFFLESKISNVGPFNFSKFLKFANERVRSPAVDETVNILDTTSSWQKSNPKTFVSMKIWKKNLFNRIFPGNVLQQTLGLQMVSKFKCMPESSAMSQAKGVAHFENI